jgi:hypothetical protein
LPTVEIDGASLITIIFLSPPWERFFFQRQNPIRWFLRAKPSPVVEWVSFGTMVVRRTFRKLTVARMDENLHGMRARRPDRRGKHNSHGPEESRTLSNARSRQQGYRYSLVDLIDVLSHLKTLSNARPRQQGFRFMLHSYGFELFVSCRPSGNSLDLNN